MSDATADTRRLRVSNVVDDHKREAASHVDRSITAPRMIELLDRFSAERGGYPESITCDNGPEFIGHAFDQWADAHGIKINFIEPSKPVQNCYLESFNGRIPDECLNQNWFTDLEDARRTIMAWTEETTRSEKTEHWDDTAGVFEKRYGSAEIANSAIPALPTALATTND